jgi:hypothetical protein
MFKLAHRIDRQWKRRMTVSAICHWNPDDGCNTIFFTYFVVRLLMFLIIFLYWHYTEINSPKVV